MPIRRTSSGSSQDTGFYNPEIFSDVGSRLVFPTDPDAAAYIAAVESADGQELEFPVKVAYNDFVLGCKSDGIWNAIKASCILAGARTLAGALTPLVGTAPTNNNFVAGDYNRKTGLVGDGSTKYLDSNAPHSISPQNNAHCSIYASTLRQAGTNFYIGVVGGSVTAIGGDTFSPPDTWVIHDTASGVPRFADSGTGFKALTRNNAANYIRRTNGVNTTVTRAASATAPSAETFTVFGRSASFLSSARLAFYSIGESLDLALLDSRVSRLVNEIAFYLNTGLPGTNYDIDTLKYINAGYAAGGTLS